MWFNLNISYRSSCIFTSTTLLFSLFLQRYFDSVFKRIDNHPGSMHVDYRNDSWRASVISGLCSRRDGCVQDAKTEIIKIKSLLWTVQQACILQWYGQDQIHRHHSSGSSVFLCVQRKCWMMRRMPWSQLAVVCSWRWLPGPRPL